ncbi:MAG: hypothetical protein KDK04_25420 [Candidatus Competibacteraceae bacterium]|nr:hypothetical protein [Candidatus Competibacteraceae bacterium]MCB1815030.1 hypothetical protein [Candidatus Competibacteraceae bacterium]
MGFAYQIGFVRLFNRFPKQDVFEIIDELLGYISVQIELPMILKQWVFLLSTCHGLTAIISERCSTTSTSARWIGCARWFRQGVMPCWCAFSGKATAARLTRRWICTISSSPGSTPSRKPISTSSSVSNAKPSGTRWPCSNPWAKSFLTTTSPTSNCEPGCSLRSRVAN